jgi:two-component system, OmpR family, response regulator
MASMSRASAPPFRVLLVDDEPVVRALVPAMLEGGGVEVRCVESGALAMQAAHEVRPDLLLLDIVMPGLDGLSVLRLVRADPTLGQVPVYMLTTRTKSADRLAAERAGASGYIEKPFKAQELQSLVEGLRHAGAEI